MKRRTVFIDMDGVLTDFQGLAEKEGFVPWTSASLVTGFYRRLPVFPSAKENVALLYEHFDLYIATSPQWENPSCFQEKQAWVKEHFPYLYAEKRMFFTNHKNLLRGDALIDDHPEWSGARNFNGTLIHFKGNWDDVWRGLEP